MPASRFSTQFSASANRMKHPLLCLLYYMMALHDGVLVHHILWSSQWHNTPWKPALNWRYHHTLIEPKTIMGLQLDSC